MRSFSVHHEISESSSASATAAADQSLFVRGSTTRFFSVNISTPAPANASASASAAAEPSSLVGEHEVFLSFCGQDTRHGFTDYLYTSLHGAGIRTFRDNENLHVGEEIGSELLKAITNSKISTPILSKNYASIPSDERHHRGSYKKAFHQHKKDGHDEKAIQEWNHALKTVERLKGLELEKESTGGHEGELAKIITNKVLDFLKRGRIGKMKELLNIHCDGVRSIGIHGIKITCTHNSSCIILKNSSKEKAPETKMATARGAENRNNFQPPSTPQALAISISGAFSSSLNFL